MNREELIEYGAKLLKTDDVEAIVKIYDRIAAIERREVLRETIGERPESCRWCPFEMMAYCLITERGVDIETIDSECPRPLPDKEPR